MDSVDNSLQTKADLVVWLPHDCHKYIPLKKNQLQTSNGRYQIIRIREFHYWGLWYNLFITFSTEVCALQMEDLMPVQSETNTYRKKIYCWLWILPLVKTCILQRGQGKTNTQNCVEKRRTCMYFFLVLIFPGLHAQPPQPIWFFHD